MSDTDTNTPPTVAEMRAFLSDLPRPKVKLTGTNGNAYAVMGTVSSVLRKAGWTRPQLDMFHAIATSGDYNNVLATCARFAQVR